MADDREKKLTRFLGDVSLPITTKIGREKMAIRQIAVLEEGALIPLGVRTDEPVDLLLGDRLLAHGECVLVNERYAIRISDIVWEE